MESKAGSFSAAGGFWMRQLSIISALVGRLRDEILPRYIRHSGG